MHSPGEVMKVFHNHQRQRWRHLQTELKKRNKRRHPRTTGTKRDEVPKIPTQEQRIRIPSEALLIRVTFFAARFAGEFATLVTRFTRRPSIFRLYPLTFLLLAMILAVGRHHRSSGPFIFPAAAIVDRSRGEKIPRIWADGTAALQT